MLGGDGEHMRRALSILGAGVLGLAGLLSYGEDQPSAAALPDTQVNDNQHPAGELGDCVLHVGLEPRMGTWHPEGLAVRGVEVAAFGVENGPLQNPGPVIRVPQGTEIHVSLRNSVPGKTLRVYGLHERPGKREELIEVPSGATREAHFTTGAAGTYFYWGTLANKALDERAAMDSQLHGAFVVDTPDHKAADRIFVLSHYHVDGDLKANPPRADLELTRFPGSRTEFWRGTGSRANSFPMVKMACSYRGPFTTDSESLARPRSQATEDARMIS